MKLLLHRLPRKPAARTRLNVRFCDLDTSSYRGLKQRGGNDIGQRS